MTNQSEHKPYDKVLKENIGQFFLSLSQKYLGISITQSEEIKDKLQTTLEKEADFLRIIHTSEGERLILHLEFQTHDEKDMIFRMQEYFAILQKKYKIPLRQFVIYLGEKTPQMRSELSEEEVYKGFVLKNIADLDYEMILDSDIPEEILLAILCNFKDEEPLKIIKKIILRLQKLSKDEITFKKYIRQVLILSRLRDLSILTHKQIKDMAFTYDIKKDALFLEGVEEGMEKGIEQGIAQGIEKGIEQGIEKGEIRTTIKNIQNALKQELLSIEQMANLFEVDQQFVLDVRDGKIIPE